MTAGQPPDLSPFDDPDGDGPTERVVPVDPEKTVVITPTDDPADTAEPGSEDLTVTVTPQHAADDESTVVVNPPAPAATPAVQIPSPPPTPAASIPAPAESPESAAQPISGGYAPARSYGTPPAPLFASATGGGYAPAVGYGAPPSTSTPPNAAPSPGKRRRGHTHWLIPAAVAAGVFLLAVVTVMVVQPRPVKALVADRLDVTAAQPAIRAVLADPAAGYGLPDVTVVSCNHGSNPHVISGTTFDCDITVAGHPLEATMTFLNDFGAYSVGRPR